VARILRESFGRKVRRSSYMRSASAIGLAIRAESLTGGVHGDAAERVHDQFNRNFGLWREADHGGNIFFDLILPRGVQLPVPGEPPLHIERIYRPAHNIGHFRYLESSQLDEHMQPIGEISNWDQILFPFDPQLRHHTDLASVPVALLANSDDLRIREEYTCDSTGSVRVKIHAEPGGFAREFTIAQSA
jgi:molecular chaperone DnaK